MNYKFFVFMGLFCKEKGIFEKTHVYYLSVLQKLSSLRRESEKHPFALKDIKTNGCSIGNNLRVYP